MSKYVPSAESLKFISFIRASGVEDNASAELHYKLADKYFSDDKQVVVEAFRGSAKSSLMEWFILYTAAMGELPGFGKVGFIAFVGDSMENGVKNTFRNITGKIDRSQFLQQFIKVTRKTDSEMELTNLDGVELYLKGYGASTNIRGVRYKGLRPSVAIMDDVTTTEAGASDTMLKTIEENFFKSIVPALHPTKFKIFYIATPVSENDLLHKLIANPSWAVHKFPICESFPCSKEEFVGAWEDRFPYEAVMEKYMMYSGAGQEQAFFQEFMMEVTDLTSRLVDPEDIRWYDPDQVMKNKGNYNYYISTDFATSTKKSADFSAIAVWAVNANGDWMLVDAVCVRQTMQDNLEDLFRLVQKWKPISVGIESSGQQGGFISILEDMMFKRNVWFNLARKRGSKEPGIRPTGDKTSRFVTGVQPMFKQGKVWLPRAELVEKKNPKLYQALQELENELSKFTLAGGVQKLAHDDMVDTLNQLSEMEVWLPSEGSEEDKADAYVNDDGDIWWPESKSNDYEGSTIF